MSDPAVPVRRLRLEEDERLRPSVVVQRVLSIMPDVEAADSAAIHIGVTVMSAGAATEHLCHSISEFIYVVDGELVMTLDRRDLLLSAGDYLTIPAGRWHAFRNETAQIALMLFAFERNPTMLTSRRAPASQSS
ncbi:cupin domain-containing protein [Acrocarpospora macrocephala]|nr:cupin domain-containing protein [Acrocarpospora macrocephala]